VFDANERERHQPGNRAHVIWCRGVGEENETDPGRLAFGTVPSEVLFDVFDSKRKTRRRPSLLYCGNDDDAKNVVAQLIRDVGFDPVDAGPLRVARYLEPFTLAIAQLAYEGDEGPELAYRIERFGK
jgi:hypothetical protein